MATKHQGQAQGSQVQDQEDWSKQVRRLRQTRDRRQADKLEGHCQGGGEGQKPK